MMLAGQMDLLGPGAIAADAAGAEAPGDGLVKVSIPLKAVIDAAARENVTIAEFFRRAVIARLELAADAAVTQPTREQVS
jgi:hypothetical protein